MPSLLTRTSNSSQIKQRKCNNKHPNLVFQSPVLPYHDCSKVLNLLQDMYPLSYILPQPIHPTSNKRNIQPAVSESIQNWKEQISLLPQNQDIHGAYIPEEAQSMTIFQTPVFTNGHSQRDSKTDRRLVPCKHNKQEGPGTYMVLNQ